MTTTEKYESVVVTYTGGLLQLRPDLEEKVREVTHALSRNLSQFQYWDQVSAVEVAKTSVPQMLESLKGVTLETCHVDLDWETWVGYSAIRVAVSYILGINSIQHKYSCTWSQ